MVHYQPIVALGTGELIGLEALVRWQHAERLIPPDEFIPLAEQSGLIVPIGTWVLERAFQDALGWPSVDGVARFLAVNVSGHQLHDPDFAGHVAAALRAGGLPPGRVKLEITESTLLEDPRQIGQTLSELRRLGVAISIDDFGTGYSSLSSIQTLPIDEFKIDRSFVESLPTVTSAAVAETIVRLGHTLGLDIVAEGIETKVQWDALRNLGCHLGQGFLFGRPMDAEKFSELLREPGHGV